MEIRTAPAHSAVSARPFDGLRVGGILGAPCLTLTPACTAVSFRTKPLLPLWAWRAEAACRGMKSSAFFSPPGERGPARKRREARALAVCRSCPARAECRTFAEARRINRTGSEAVSPSDSVAIPGPVAEQSAEAHIGVRCRTRRLPAIRTV